MERTPPMGSTPSKCHTEKAASPNDTANAPVATPPESAFGRRRPKTALMTKPTNGRSGISASTPSPFQAREDIGTEGLTMPEERDDDGQADGRLGGRDGHDEEHDD